MGAHSRNAKRYDLKRMVVADLDGTLSEDRVKISTPTADLINKLLEKRRFAVLTASTYEKIREQLLNVLLPRIDRDRLANLYLLPNSGAIMYRFANGRWRKEYEKKLSVHERNRIKGAVSGCIRDLKPWGGRVYGKRVDDRVSQVSFAVLGRDAPLGLKKRWDPSGKKRRRVAKFLMGRIPEFGIAVGGLTTIDITRKGMDKAFGIRCIKQRLGYKTSEILFLGDKIWRGGNDYLIKQEGVDCISVNSPHETNKVLIDVINS